MLLLLPIVVALVVAVLCFLLVVSWVDFIWVMVGSWGVIWVSWVTGQAVLLTFLLANWLTMVLDVLLLALLDMLTMVG